jgi:hypothetical protein
MRSHVEPPPGVAPEVCAFADALARAVAALVVAEIRTARPPRAAARPSTFPESCRDEPRPPVGRASRIHDTGSTSSQRRQPISGKVGAEEMAHEKQAAP